MDSMGVITLMTIRNVVIEQLEWWKAPTSWDHKLRGAYTLQQYTSRHRVQTAPLGNLQEQILDCYSQGFCYFLLASWNHETVNHPLLTLTSTQKKQTCILPEIKGYEETPIWEELSSAPPRLSQGRPLRHIKPPICEKTWGNCTLRGLLLNKSWNADGVGTLNSREVSGNRNHPNNIP